MKRFILFVAYGYITCFLSYSQQWILIEKAEDVSAYMRIDSRPVSPRNETHFKSYVSSKLAEKWKKEYQYESLPYYELTSDCYDDSFSNFATRTYNIYEKENKPIFESFHGFLTFDSIVGGRIMYYAMWAYILKQFGENACICASQTQYQNNTAQWIKFDEDENMERFIRIDLNNVDSIAMYKVVYKARLAKDLQKTYSFRELPVSRIFVWKWVDSGSKALPIAESYFGKKSALSIVWIYTDGEPEVIGEGINKVYHEWTQLLYDKGKEAVIERSNRLFGGSIKK